MKKYKKLKDELTKKDSKRIEKRSTKHKKARLNPSDNRPPKYRIYYINEEE